MNLSRISSFLLSLVLVGVALHFLPYDEEKVALNRTESLLQEERGFKETVSEHCTQMTLKENSVMEKFFVDRLFVPAEGGTLQPCLMTVQAASRNRFGLRSFWNFAVQFSLDDGTPFLEKNFHVEFARPLSFLPVAGLLLAIGFSIPWWGIGWTIFAYLLCLTGANAIRGTELLWESGISMLRTEQTFVGLLLMVIWLSLYRSRHEGGHLTSQPKRYERWTNRAAQILVGAWNPMAYTVAGKFFYPFRGHLSKIETFLDSQLVVFCLSLYLFSFDSRSPFAALQKGALAPRYFTFTVLILLVVSYWSRKPKPQALIWKQPRIWRAAIVLAVLELVQWRTGALADWSTLIKVAIALIASEISVPRGLQIRLAGRNLALWGSSLFLVFFLVGMARDAGVGDLAMVLLRPEMHPGGLVLFTFLAGIGLGFLTGSFSASFFGLLPLVLKAHDSSLVKAALLDGLLAGSLLSPFSLYNLFTATLFSIDVKTLLRFRYQQLGLPILIGGCIYGVSAINSVAILRPVSFVFLCLLALAFRVRKSEWFLNSGGPTQRQLPA